MGDKTLVDRVIDLECAYGELGARLERLLSGVVLVERRKPGPARGEVGKKRGVKIRVKPGFKRPRRVVEGEALPRGVTVE